MMRVTICSLMLATTMLLGCATFHLVPAGHQPVAQADITGVIISVPRLDTDNYPGDVLHVATPVLVIIENRSSSEVLIEPERFLLGRVGGMQQSPLAPQKLTMHQPATTSQRPDAILESHGPGVYVDGKLVWMSSSGRISTGPSVRIGVPGWRGGYYTPKSYDYAYSRWGSWSGGPLDWGPQWSVSWYGNRWFWPWFYDGPRYYTWSRADAVRLALPAGRLPPGGRTGGFLYFPRIKHSQSLSMSLQAPLRDATSQQVRGTALLTLEMQTD